MYAYRTSVLKEITQLPPSSLELTEKLEQLRWLENGYHIAVAETQWQSPAVDTPEDLEKARLFLGK
jgi:3-deoxy-manno-octulosonate cytidylyltransferase (CMP-KDO synthetase)